MRAVVVLFKEGNGSLFMWISHTIFNVSLRSFSGKEEIVSGGIFAKRKKEKKKMKSMSIFGTMFVIREVVNGPQFRTILVSRFETCWSPDWDDIR